MHTTNPCNLVFTIPTNTLFLYTSANFHLSFFAYNHSSNLHKKYFLYYSIYQIQSASRDQGAMESREEWHCFSLSLLNQSMESYNKAHNQWFRITQAQKIGVLQLVVFDEDAPSTEFRVQSN